MRLQPAVVEDLHQQAAAVGERVHPPLLLALQLLGPPLVLLLLPLLKVVLVPDVLKIGANDADRESQDAQAPDCCDTRGKLAQVCRRVHVAVADCRGGHHGPPEGVRDGHEGACHYVALVGARLGVQDPALGPLVLAGGCMVLALLDEEDHGAKDQDVEAKVQHQDPEDPQGTLHGLGDDDDRLQAPAQAEGAHHAHEPRKPQQHQRGVAALARLAAAAAGEGPGHVGGHDSREVDEVGPGADEGQGAARAGGHVERLLRAGAVDEALLVGELRAHDARRREAQEVLHREKDDANGVDPVEGLERLRLTARAALLLHARHRGDDEAPGGEQDGQEHEHGREAAQAAHLRVLQRQEDALGQRPTHRELFLVPEQAELPPARSAIAA
mmetsp:Transcript_59810/g.165400  ORF Transcript_59810/g.165400 Transcript_59810/m.165400 type:complete len:385 (-) Transcript_59810:293-1447(-)